MNIIFNCGTGNKEWYPGSFSGGSEEQTILLADLFSENGHNVTVYNSIQKQQLFNQVAYLPGATFDSVKTSCDLYLGWRNWRFFKYRFAPIQVLLCHDIPVEAHFPSHMEQSLGALDNIDYVHVLNEHHRKLYLDAGCPAEKLVVIPIIIEKNPYVDQIERDLHKCIWLCHPNRGIHKLREFWPEIKRQVPQATLQPCWWDEADRQFFVTPDEALGIKETLICSHDELNKQLASSYIFPYCSTFEPEISPASCLKSQNSGVTPIVIAKGGMRSTLGDNAIFCSENDFTNVVVNRLLLTLDAKEFLTTQGVVNLDKHRISSVHHAWERSLYAPYKIQ
jgi:hypothetical protein